MDTTKTCPSCGKPLAPNAPAGLCPECLMHTGFPTGTEPQPPGTKHFHFRPPSLEELKPHFPQLEILSFIGQGGMGAVYKARQPMLDRYVALKILPPEAATGPGFTERFTREARALARLNHPNIVAVHEFGQTTLASSSQRAEASSPSPPQEERAGERRPFGYHYLIMEFVDGANLRELERAQRLSPAQALSIVPKICDALQYAHDEGIVHRDIKPENILVDKKGRVKIADFGIAKILGAEQPHAPLTGVVGTPHYMAPEQVEKPQTVDHRADIYSLGVVFYEMLTGELPLGRFAAPSKKVQIDVRLDEVVLRALEKEPEQRYQQANHLKTQVETITSMPKGAPRSNKSEEPSVGTQFLLVLSLLICASMFTIGVSGPGFVRKILLLLGLAGGIVLGPKLFAMWRLNRRVSWAIAIALVMLLAGSFFLARNPSMTNETDLANDPFKLRSVSTSEVIEAGLNKPQVPWAWQELQNRAQAGRLSSDEANELLSKLTARLTRKPDGDQQPLVLGNLLADLHDRHLFTQSNEVAFVIAYSGAPTFESLPQIRDNVHTLNFQCNFGAPQKPFGLEFLNYLKSATLDGQPISLKNVYPRDWRFLWVRADAVGLNLTPGKHELHCQIVSSLVSTNDIAGLREDAPPEEWPKGIRHWTRTAKGELAVYPTTAQMVKLSDDPALNPVAQGALAVQQVIIRLTKGQPTAVVSLDLNPRPALPISVDVSLQLSGQDVKFGNVQGVQEANRTVKTAHPLQTAIQPLDATVTNATVILTPNPSAVEQYPSVSNIWAKVIVIPHVPLVRQDLPSKIGSPEAQTNQSAADVINIGQRYFPKGDSIDITSVERRSDSIVVRGRYKLISSDRATLTFNITATNSDFSRTIVSPGQSVHVAKGEGTFELSHTALYLGLPHVSMYGANRRPFATIYFGTKAEAEQESRFQLTNEFDASPSSK